MERSDFRMFGAILELEERKKRVAHQYHLYNNTARRRSLPAAGSHCIYGYKYTFCKGKNLEADPEAGSAGHAGAADPGAL